MAQLNITVDTDILHGFFTSNGRDEAFSKLLKTILNQVLDAQSVEQLGAERYERNDTRVGYRNGYRERDITTRIGTITLQVPRHRDGEFNTDMFNRYQRSEQALILAMVEMVIHGVSTRKIKMVTEELCGKSFSKSTISSLCQQLDPIVEAFRNRPLEKHYPFVFVRCNEEIRRRERVIRIFPNADSAIRLIGALLIVQDEKWSTGRKYFEMDDYYVFLKEQNAGQDRVAA